ncbi:hypothetical protein IWQ61_005071 [Dispira simplex]|nr:hypothetical protein IWQ61_005071 [Dispira simplex]
MAKKASFLFFLVALTATAVGVSAVPAFDASGQVPAMGHVEARGVPAEGSTQAVPGIKRDNMAEGVESNDPLTATANNSPVIVGYYPDWVTRSMQPEQIPYGKVTHLNYAFAILTDNYSLKFDTDWLLPRVVKQAHEKGTKVLISVGGWTGSRYFTPMAASSQGRATFIRNSVDFVKKYELDGVDIDWEYPGRLGMGCNTFDAQHDTDNFLQLLKELRQQLDKDFGTSEPQRKMITLAVRVEPFDGPKGPISDASAFAPYLDFVNIMSYDVYGSWSSTTGPNAPFNAAGESNWSFTQAADSWIKAKFPKNKLVMGTALYGRSAKTLNNPNSQFVSKEKIVPKGDQDDALWAEPCPGSPSVFSGVWQWRNLRSQGALSSPETAGPGWVRHWDDITQTPWLFRESDKTFVSYDDPKSLGIKVNHVKKLGLRGVMSWDLHQDNGELMDTLQQVRH